MCCIIFVFFGFNKVSFVYDKNELIYQKYLARLQRKSFCFALEKNYSERQDKALKNKQTIIIYTIRILVLSLFLLAVSKN
jgi:hypothetical protein